MPVFSIPANLDLTNPADFLMALYWARDWPNPKPLPEAQFVRDLPIIETYHTAIFDLRGRARSVFACDSLLIELGSERTLNRVPVHGAPREWLAVFRAAFDQGLINRIVWGTVASFFAAADFGSAFPGQPRRSLEARRALLHDMRRASPMGIMERRERDIWRNLPDTVILYRGGRSPCLDLADALVDASSTIHWTPDATISTTFMRDLTATSTMAAIKSAAVNLPMLSIGHKPLQNAAQGLLTRELGQTYLIRADVPRELILAYWVGSGTHREMFVDFERLRPGMITDITPAVYRRAA